MSAVVAGLYVYPVKSCGGIEVDRAQVDAFGFRDDRRWMIVDREGRFLTQRTLPLLATIHVRLANGRLTLRSEGWDEIEIDVSPDGASPEPVVVWRDTVEAVGAGEAADGWLSSVFGRPTRLVWMPSDTQRLAKRDPARTHPRISFADGFPFLVTSRGSLDALNARLEKPLPMNRFRPNIVVEGVDPFAEDGWVRFRIGAVEFDAGDLCARCTTTTVDQQTGARGVEPLRTLATFRRQGDQVMFGLHAIHHGTGEVSVGMPVEVLECR